MGIGCGAFLAKVFLFIFNFGFFLAGAGMMAIGIWLRVDPRSAAFTRIISVSGNDTLLQTAAIVLAVVGGLIFITGFLGCCGALCNNTCMLLLYTIIVTTLALAQITAGILAAVFSRQVGDTVRSSMEEGLRKYDGNSLLSRAWDSMQVWLKCCGTNGHTDWRQNPQNNATWPATYPPSCCRLKNADPNKIIEGNMVDATACRTEAARGYNAQGCYNGLVDWIRRNAHIIIGVAFGVIAIQILVASMACCLRTAIKRESDKFV